ncbi:MAG: DUF2723 domain-containing protein [Sedimentisphaerales bacterium]|nr:DUF2723 domain-containing protein [Sedimentisphaerales bacterium]
MRSERREIAVGYLVVLAASLLLYGVSCAPGLLWQDSGMIQYRVWNNDIEGNLGLALSHPLFYVLAIGAKYIPAGQFAHRINLVSAVAAAVAVANLFLFIRLWLGRNFPAMVAAVTFGLSHTFWTHASIIETYTLYIALFLAGLTMLLQYLRTGRRLYLYLLGLFEGLAISDHMFASIPLLCYAVFLIVLLVKKDIRLRDIAVFAMFWVIGAGLYEYLIIKSLIQTGDIAGTLASAAFGHGYRSAVLNTSLSARLLKEDFLYILLNFPTPNILLFFVGCFALFKLPLNPRLRNIVFGLLILFLLFAFRYTVVDRYAFFIPFYCVVSVFVGIGVHSLEPFLRHRSLALLVLVFAVLPFGVYLAAPVLAEKVGLRIGTKRQIDYRNDYEYFLRPWQTGYGGAERFAVEALEMVEQNGAIYADSTTVYPLLCMQQVKQMRRDIKIVSSRDSSKGAPVLNENTAAGLMANSALYVVSPVKGYCLPFLLDNYNFVQAGVLWRVVERK